MAATLLWYFSENQVYIEWNFRKIIQQSLDILNDIILMKRFTPAIFPCNEMIHAGNLSLQFCKFVGEWVKQGFSRKHLFFLPIYLI